MGNHKNKRVRTPEQTKALELKRDMKRQRKEEIKKLKAIDAYYCEFYSKETIRYGGKFCCEFARWEWSGNCRRCGAADCDCGHGYMRRCDPYCKFAFGNYIKPVVNKEN